MICAAITMISLSFYCFEILYIYIYYFIFMCMDACPCVCLCTLHMVSTCGGKKRVSDLVEMTLHTIVNYYESAGN